MNKTHEWIGKITNREKAKVYNKKSSYYGNIYYRLTLELEKETDIKEWNLNGFNKPLEILVFQDSPVFRDIQEANYIDKRYWFICSPLISNYRIVSYQLVNWKELPNQGNLLDKDQELKNYEKN